MNRDKNKELFLKLVQSYLNTNLGIKANDLTKDKVNKLYKIVKEKSANKINDMITNNLDDGWSIITKSKQEINTFTKITEIYNKINDNNS
ncbi:MAG TPA: hypothetical protein PLD27_06440 [bacterium]|nr:hypothetical protein [bacterium]HOL47505.1 hypothetical protein [bacterium]HPQ18811.1 hypothetical protein [bacterium]